MFDPLALALATAGTVAALASALVARSHVSVSGKLVAALLALGVALSFVHDALYLPGVNVDPAALGAFRPILFFVACLVASLAWRGAPRWLGIVRFGAVVLAASFLGALVIHASPSPAMDVWTMQQQGANALVGGYDPYAIAYPNVYGPGTPYISPELLTPDGRYVLGFPYMPLILLLDVPSAWLGDVRWTMLVAVAVAAVLIRSLGRGALVAELAACLLLVQPQAFFLLEMAWTEPVALALALAAALAAARSVRGAAGWRSWGTSGLLLGLAISSKQYMVLVLAPLLLVYARRHLVRILAVAAAVAAVIAVPFLVADPAAFLHGVLKFQVLQPFRPDALSWPAAIVALGGPVLPSWPAFVLAGATFAVTVRRELTVARALLAGGAFWAVLVIFNKQAFLNYYWFALGLLAAGVAALAADRAAPLVGGTPAEP